MLNKIEGMQIFGGHTQEGTEKSHREGEDAPTTGGQGAIATGAIPKQPSTYPEASNDATGLKPDGDKNMEEHHGCLFRGKQIPEPTISSTKHICVAMYVTGSTCDGGDGHRKAD